ncbi:hypothetical protein GLOTRDRAFT_140043 [Gloeophyllum trabeum ATCC 11539]|uniref:Uncharacterized protein n=1 Tax=Gloeophyllum trabeum (strain ATCC 11539 / FP-39264 / Madison 617) TaxID=670483 RepID=S7Q0T5_GLOTA|nr:uncharacterized protein GLOTRDRAFT_140043 [Gloeophyllum trabeum ATCC 11539]EPQ53117.1 hypothetical protein GLOTRDRAFT_140043 [Gloeophyllum trabeum ATCC 11539]
MPGRPYPPIKAGKFECDSEGFKVKGHERASQSDIEHYLGMTPNFTKKGNLSKRQPDLTRPRAWWEAQIAFYNLKTGKSIAAMQDILRAAVNAGTLSVPQATLDLETRMKREYAELSARAVADQYAACTTDEERVHVDAERFLRETFDRKKDPRVELYVVKGSQSLDRFGIYQAAERLMLQTRKAHTTHTDGKATYWVVVGRDNSKVYGEALRIESEDRRRAIEDLEQSEWFQAWQESRRHGHESSDIEADEEGSETSRSRRVPSARPGDDEDSNEGGDDGSSQLSGILAVESSSQDSDEELLPRASRKQYRACFTDEQRVTLDPFRFLRKTFYPKKGHGPWVELYVVKGGPKLDRYNVRRAAKKLLLYTFDANGYDAEGTHCTSWVVIGRDERQVREHGLWLHEEARRRATQQRAQENALANSSKRSARDSEDEGRPTKRGRKRLSWDLADESGESNNESEDGSRSHSQSSGLRESSQEETEQEDVDEDEEDEGDLEYTRDPDLKPITNRKFPNALDVSGTWTISAPALAREWPHTSGNMHFNFALHKAKGKKGGDILFAEFNLGILEGIMAFDKPPTPQVLETTFLWRGRETGEGQMQIAGDYNCGKISFDSGKTKFTGVFASTYGTWNIEGRRVNSKAFSGSTFKADYEGYTEDAYEDERVSRWH